MTAGRITALALALCTALVIALSLMTASGSGATSLPTPGAVAAGRDLAGMRDGVVPRPPARRLQLERQRELTR